MIYYAADLHFGHGNILHLCNRPFERVEEMDQAMIDTWNSRVRPEDMVYIVGDMFYRNVRPAEEYLAAMKGHKVLVMGNHDLSWLKDGMAGKYFDRISHMENINDNGNQVTLCHYPMMTWSGEKTGSYMVYGHIHNHTDFEFWPLILKNDHMLNAGVEINSYCPVTLAELILNNKTFKQLSVKRKSLEWVVDKEMIRYTNKE